MENLIYTYEIRWADIDANQHLRHSAYSDYACHARVALFTGFGLSYPELSQMALGPILFREETVYYREIHLGEKIKVVSELPWISDDGKKWTFKQKILKMDKGLAGMVITDGAFLDLKIRKIAIPPVEVHHKMIKIKHELEKYSIPDIEMNKEDLLKEALDCKQC